MEEVAQGPAQVRIQAGTAATAVMEGPALPPSLPYSSSSSGASSPQPSPNRGARGRSPLRDYRSDRPRSPSRSPPRKRAKQRSPDRWREYSPERRGRGYRNDYEPRFRDRRYRDRRRSPSPGRISRMMREEKDQQYGVVKEERGARIVFVVGLPLDTMEVRLEEWFESHDLPVRDVQLIFDKQRKFKGMAYIEFYQKTSVPSALKLTGQLFQGRPLTIENADNERNASLVGMASAAPSDAPSGQLLRLYVGNLDYGITQEDLRQLLLQFGPVESVRLQTEPTGKSKGHAFVQFYQKEHALAAFHKLNTITLCNRQIRCDFTKDARTRDPDLPPSPPLTGRTTHHYTSDGTLVGPSSHLSLANGSGATSSAPQPQGDISLLDDDSKATSQNMHSLIQRLAASTSGAITTANVSQPAPASTTLAMPPAAMLIPTIDKSTLPSPGVPSAALCLKNMFDPSTETDPNFDKEIQEDVASEAINFGRLEHIFVDKTSFGDVYMLFSSVSGAENAVNAMHGRFFAGRLVRAEYLSESTYRKKFSL